MVQINATITRTVLKLWGPQLVHHWIWFYVFILIFLSQSKFFERLYPIIDANIFICDFKILRQKRYKYDIYQKKL